jgi:chromosome segregation ATPase
MSSISMRYASLLSTTAIVLFGLSVCTPALAEGQPNAPSSPAPKSAIANPMREQFRDGLKQFQGNLDEVLAAVDTVMQKLAKQSEATVGERKTEVEGLRQKLTNLGTQVQPDAPLLQRLDRFEQWVTAQRSRIENLRERLGVDFVEDRLKNYKEMQAEVGAAREQLAASAKGVDGLLNELSRAEDRMAELMLAEDAAAVTKELKDVVGAIGKTIDEIRNRIRQQFGTAGV